jgi:cysteine desulfurase
VRGTGVAAPAFAATRLASPPDTREMNEPPPLERVYLDYGGFAPVDARVMAVMRPFLEAGIGNPSAPHTLGAEARAALEAARVKVGRLCGGSASGLIFTSGATEANNLAIKGAVGARRAGGASRVIISAVEHASVVEPCRELERGGAEVVVVPTDGDGRVDVDALRGALRGGADLVSIAAASADLGTLQPLSEIGRATRAADVPLHVDAVGALGRVPLAAEATGIDLLTISGNDIYGPPGTGALWVRPELRLRPQIVGGGQESGCRGGIENLPGLVGLGVAAELMRSDGLHEEAPRLAALRDELLEGLLDRVDDCRLTGARVARLPQHLSVALPGAQADQVLSELDAVGIAASSGAACASRRRTPSTALGAIGCSPEEVEGSLCFTLGRWSTPADVTAVLAHLPAIACRVRSSASLARR